MIGVARSARTAVHTLALLALAACKTDQKSPAPAVSGAPPSSSAPATNGLRRFMGEDHAMGTSVVIHVFAPADAELPKPAQRSIDDALSEIKRLEGLMSTWIPTSDVVEVNAHAFERPVHVGPDTLHVLEKAEWASRISHGAFDVTFEVMHGLWRFDHDLDGKIPDPKEVEAQRAKIDWRAVQLDTKKSEVRFTKPDTKINLGGIAKGYAIDRMAAILLDGGLRDFLVQAGGDLYAHGKKPDGSPWMVGVRDPRGPEGSFFGALPVEDHAFSTAGDYERTFVKDGKRYHHILDPRTGYPATASRSVTLWAPDALTADAIDDGLFILGPEEAIPLCDSIDGCGAIIVDSHNKVWVSKRVASLFRQDRPPTDGP